MNLGDDIQSCCVIWAFWTRGLPEIESKTEHVRRFGPLDPLQTEAQVLETFGDWEKGERITSLFKDR